MFTVENIIGDIVYLSFRDKSFLKKLAIPERPWVSAHEAIAK